MTRTSHPPSSVPLASPLLPLSRRGRAVEHLKLFATIVQQRFKEDQNFQQAAALAYNTLFSLLPTLVLGLLVLSIISSPPRRAATTEPSSQATTAPVTEEPASAAREPEDTESIGFQAQQWVLTQLGLDQIKIQMVHNGKPQEIHLSTLIGERIERVRRLVQSPGTGMIAFAVLVYGVISLMLVTERTFNSIYRAPKGRVLARRFALYTCLFIWGPLGIAGSIYLSQAFHHASDSMVHVVSWILAPLSLLAGAFVSWFLLLIVYKLIPETHVRWRSAALGAFVGAVLWELGKYGFGLYLRFSVGTRNWYGGIALVPLFMLWIYLTWNFVLLGLQIAYIHQYFGPLAQRVRQTHTFRIPVVDVRWMLPLGIVLYDSFKAGKPLEPEAAALRIGVPPDVVCVLLKGMQNAGLAHAVDYHGSEAFVLSRPPEQINAAALLAAGTGLSQLIASTSTPATNSASAPPGAPSTPALREFDALQLHWGESRNLRQLAGDTT